MRTTTDNFLKAFKVFGEETNNKEVPDDAEPGEEEENEGEEEVEFAEVSVILNENDGFEFGLPQHACHLLNLVFTVYAEKQLPTMHTKKRPPLSKQKKHLSASI